MYRFLLLKNCNFELKLLFVSSGDCGDSFNFYFPDGNFFFGIALVVVSIKISELNSIY